MPRLKVQERVDGSLIVSEIDDLTTEDVSVQGDTVIPAPRPGVSGDILVVDSNGRFQYASLSTRGNLIATLDIVAPFSKTDSAQPGPDQVWTLSGSLPQGFSLGPLEIGGERFPTMMVPRMPLILPNRWDGLWLVSNVGNQDVETIIQDWQPESVTKLLNTDGEDSTKPILNLLLSRNRQGVPFRFGWSLTRVFAEENFLLENGAAVGTSDGLIMTATPDEYNVNRIARPERPAGYAGFWLPVDYEPTDIQRSSEGPGLGQSAFEGFSRFLFKDDRQLLTVEGTDGAYYSTRNALISTSFANRYATVRFAPGNEEVGTRFPITTGPFQAIFTGISGKEANLENNTEIKLYAHGIFYT